MDWARQAVRRFMGGIAKAINSMSGGAITPNMITYLSLLAHIPIAWLIAKGYFGYASIGIIVFGLLDTLDGELARLQNKASSAGMLLDASTDRMKEVLLYIGAAYVLISSGEPYMAVWAVAACGGSLLVSYVKAKGETAVAGGKLSANEVNRLFQDGILRYEIRMVVLILGLLLNQLGITIAFIAILTWLTAFQRLIKISQKLKHVQD